MLWRDGRFAARPCSARTGEASRPRCWPRFCHGARDAGRRLRRDRVDGPEPSGAAWVAEPTMSSSFASFLAQARWSGVAGTRAVLQCVFTAAGRLQRLHGDLRNAAGAGASALGALEGAPYFRAVVRPAGAPPWRARSDNLSHHLRRKFTATIRRCRERLAERRYAAERSRVAGHSGERQMPIVLAYAEPPAAIAPAPPRPSVLGTMHGPWQCASRRAPSMAQTFYPRSGVPLTRTSKAARPSTAVCPQTAGDLADCTALARGAARPGLRRGGAGPFQIASPISRCVR